MKHLLGLVIILVTLPAAAQKDKKPSILGKWIVTDFSAKDTVHSNGTLKLKPEQMKEARQEALSSFFRFMEDSTFRTSSKQHGNGRGGTWSLNEEEKLLKLLEVDWTGTKSFGTYIVNYIRKEKMKWTMSSDRHGVMTLVLQRYHR